MTAVCPGGGPSQPVPGVQTAIYLTGGGLALVFARWGMSWAAEVAGFMGGISFNLVDICNTDPPADPGITASDIVDLINVLDTTAAIAAAAKFSQLAQRFIWYDFCQCVTGPQPAAPAAPGAPAGSTAVNPSPPTTGTGTAPKLACYTQSLTSGTLPQFFGIGYTVGGQSISVIDNTGAGFATYGYVGLFVYLQPLSGPGTNGNVHWLISWSDSRGVLLRRDTGPSIVVNGSGSAMLTPPAGWSSVQAFVVGETAGQGNAYQATCFWYLPETSPSPISVATVPDVATQATLQQVEQLLSAMQRYHVPFAYQNGATHMALAGDGEILIPQLVGVKVTPSAVPGDSGITAGDPDELWLDSWITWGNADGWTAREWLTHSPQISLPDNAQLYTKLGYSLRPGLVVNIQELEAEA